MRPPRLLALLIVLAALLSAGAWWFVRQQPAAAASEVAESSAAQPPRDTEAVLEGNSTAERKEEPASADAGPKAKRAPRALANSTRILGRVVRGAGELPVAGLEVVCTRELAPTRVEGSLVLDGDGRRIFAANGGFPEAPHASARSGADGSFEFKELDRGALYTLTARGTGWMLVHPLLQVAPSEEARTLAVRRVYVARVLATDEDGKSLSNACQYMRYARVAGPGECDSEEVQESPALASRLPQVQGLEPEPECRGYSFASECDAGSLGPFRVLLCCAGFERKDFEFWAYPEEQRAEPTVLRLQRAAAVTGSLRVLQDCACKDSFCAHLLEGRVLLEPVEPGAQTLEFELTGLVREQSFSNIPGGTWHARVLAKHGGFQYPPAGEPPLELVFARAESLLHLPVGNLGAIRWKLRGPGDKLASEALPLSWRDASGSESSTQLWMSVAMRGVEAGPHEFEFDAARYSSVEGASYAPGGTKARLTVDVKPGETQTIVVHTP